MKRELSVGLVFAVLLGGLVAATIFVEKPGFFRRTPPFPMTVQFQDVSGLRPGSEVWIYGTRAGRVAGIRPNGQGAVDVELDLDYDPQMREEHVVRIERASVLGGSVVSIHPGRPKKETGEPNRLAPRATYEGESGSSLLDKLMYDKAFANRVEAISRDVERFTPNLNRTDTLLGKLVNSDELGTKFSRVADDLAKFTEKLNREDTLLSKLLDEKTGEKFDRITSRLDQFTENLGRKDTLLGKVVNTDELGTRFTRISEDLETFTGKLNRTDTLLGKLVNSDELGTKFTRIADDLAAFSEKLGRKDTLLGKIVGSEEFGAKFTRITDNLDGFAAKLNGDKGTLAKLLNDETLYTDLKVALKKLGGGAEDVRENAPVLTFAGFLFSGF